MNGDVSGGLESSSSPNGKHGGELEESVENSTAIGSKKERLVNGYSPAAESDHGLINGVVTNGGRAGKLGKPSQRLQEIPLEIRQQFEGAFLPLSKVIERSAQRCWTGLLAMVEELSHVPVPPAQSLPKSGSAAGFSNGVVLNDQSKANLDKKDKLLRFASEQKADFIKLLVLLQWSKDAEDVNLVLQLNLWLHSQRMLYHQAAFETAAIKRRLASLQSPKPDLKTAAEVLSLGKVSAYPVLEYIPQKPLSDRTMLKTLQDLNVLLCSRLILHESIPTQLRCYQIHDGRVTFLVRHEFELDLSVMEEDPSSRFYCLDFRFAFSPSAEIPDRALCDDICRKSTEILRDGGLLLLYEFLHDLTLSYKLKVLHKQAIKLLQGQWNSHLSVDLIRRTLTVQYWTSRHGHKSWIEIGIRSGQQKKIGDITPQSEAFLALRWMKDQKEVEDASLSLDANELSMDSILRRMLSQHITAILDPTYQTLAANPLYANGDLLLEQTSSPLDPNECHLELDLTPKYRITVTIEPISGSIVFMPSTPISARFEHELLQSKNLANDLPSRLLHLRCAFAEQCLMKSAETSDWVICRTAKPSPVEHKILFTTSGNLIRTVFLRRSPWSPDCMIAATFSTHGDSWWLVRRVVEREEQSRWTSQHIESAPSCLGNVYSHSYLESLGKFGSGTISLQANADYLTTLPVKFVLPPLPRFEKHYKLHYLRFEFDPSRLRQILGLKPSLGDSDSFRAADEFPLPQKSLIRSTVALRYRQLDGKSRMAVYEAEGQTSVPRRVLEYLAKSSLDPLIDIDPSSGRFSVRLQAPVGVSVMTELFHKLLHLENILACSSIVMQQSRMALTSLSLSTISFRYFKDSQVELICSINFGDPERVKLKLSPPEINPHVRILAHLQKVLDNAGRCFSDNLRLMIPLLSFTQPLLTLFQRLQHPESPATVESGTQQVTPRMNIIPRHSTMYGVQYFAPSASTPTMPAGSEGSPRMVARLEVLPCQRGRQTFWILRPAIEEFETYVRPSFPAMSLQQLLRQEVFSKRDPDGGWLPLGNGAACHIHRPERLLENVHDLIAAWLHGAQDIGGTVSPEAPTTQTKNATPSRQPNRTSPTQSKSASGKALPTAKGAPSGSARGVHSQKGREVITLD